MIQAARGYIAAKEVVAHWQSAAMGEYGILAVNAITRAVAGVVGTIAGVCALGEASWSACVSSQELDSARFPALISSQELDSEETLDWLPFRVGTIAPAARWIFLGHRIGNVGNAGAIKGQ